MFLWKILYLRGMKPRRVWTRKDPFCRLTHNTRPPLPADPPWTSLGSVSILLSTPSYSPRLPVFSLDHATVIGLIFLYGNNDVDTFRLSSF